MSLVNPLPWIQAAQKDGWAVGAFNANTMEQVQAVAMAARLEDAPALIQVSHRALQYVGQGNTILGLQYMAAAGKLAALSVEVPLALHLDHATEEEVLQAIALGFTSVMFDGDGLTFDENVAATARLREIAHSMGVCMEGEIDDVPKPLGQPFNAETIEYTRPDHAKAFVDGTDVDLLAISLGSVHGMKDKSLTLNMDALQAIRKVVDTPLVLHGSSGVTYEDIGKGVKLGLAKVNVATLLNRAFTERVRETLAEDLENVDPRKYLGPARDAQIEAVRESIRFFGAAGKANAI